MEKPKTKQSGEQGENDRIRDQVASYLRALPPDDLLTLATLDTSDAPGSSPGTRPSGLQVEKEWWWGDFYRADVAVVASNGVPVLIVEVDVTTPGKAAVGAMFMAAHAMRDHLRNNPAFTSLTHALWFQVVTEDKRIAERLEFFRNALPGLPDGTIRLGQQVLSEKEASQISCWRCARPDLLSPRHEVDGIDGPSFLDPPAY